MEGREHTRIYRAMTEGDNGVPQMSPLERHFCENCSSNLWVWDSRWPELLHPFASAIDTPLPYPPERTHLMLGSKADWVPVLATPEDKQFDEYPEQSIAEWQEHHDLSIEFQ